MVLGHPKSTGIPRADGLSTGPPDLALQKNLHLETDNSVSNLSRNRIPDGLETKFSVLKTLVCDFDLLKSVSDYRRKFPSLIRDGLETDFSISKLIIPKANSVSDQRRNFRSQISSLNRDGLILSLIRDEIFGLKIRL